AAKSCFSEMRTCDDAMVRRPTLRRARSIIKVMVAMSANPLLTCRTERFVEGFVFMDIGGRLENPREKMPCTASGNSPVFTSLGLPYRETRNNPISVEKTK
ncbi:hypothetical protein, partial [uncultured Akkermansia sp.]|uniref:hypothetical protein n=1 Tax=uncultured Akkermansia sp. TaxID=512294 RepID=UPI00266FC436